MRDLQGGDIRLLHPWEGAGGQVRYIAMCEAPWAYNMPEDISYRSGPCRTFRAYLCLPGLVDACAEDILAPKEHTGAGWDLHIVASTLTTIWLPEHEDARLGRREGSILGMPRMRGKGTYSKERVDQLRGEAANLRALMAWW